MCGIVGITSNKEVTTRILSSLKKLEYRGYDSAGIATLKNGFINEVNSLINFPFINLQAAISIILSFWGLSPVVSKSNEINSSNSINGSRSLRV